jgi:hypothetical protein
MSSFAADRGLPRVVNRPAVAAIEARLSDDRGLLADGQNSISDMFSADKPNAIT